MSASTPNMRLRGSLSILLCASVWGLFWIPLRYFDENGVHGLWAIAALLAACTLVAVPAAIYQKEYRPGELKWILILAWGFGSSHVCYFASLILTDVVRAVMLFYLLPIWATIASKLFYNITIGPQRMIAIALALAGVWLLLGGGSWPIPQNLGDVLAIFGGMFWALGLTIIRDRNDVGPLAVTGAALAYAFVFAVVLAFAIAAWRPSLETAPPTFDALTAIAIPIIVFGMLIVWPTMSGQLWGARFIPSTTAALLTMSEIVVATISSALLIGSDLGLIAWSGGGLILVAIFLDLYAGNAETADA